MLNVCFYSGFSFLEHIRMISVEKMEESPSSSFQTK